jgi:hypothetical protein
MSDNDLIRRGDALALMRHDPFLIGVREDCAGMAPDEDGDWVSFHAIAALPAADPLEDPRVQALVEALKHMVNHAILDEQNEGVFWEAVPLARAALAEFEKEGRA